MSIWWYIAVMVISIIIQIALTPKPQQPRPATFDDFEFPQADEGTPQAVIFGDCWTKGWQVLTYGNMRQTAITKSGGKK